MTMLEAIFGAPARAKATKQNWDFVAAHPVRSLLANSLDEVLPLLEEVEQHSREGLWVALMLSYEAAPAFDPALKTHAKSEFPLAVAAVFAGDTNNKLSSLKQHYQPANWEPQLTAAEFQSSISEIHERIAKGDTYQVNFTFPLVTNFHGDPTQWYHDLCQAQHAHYSAYLDLGRYKVLSLSPELFFARRGDAIITRPMKGTIRRGRWPAEDEEMARRLAHSAKDGAENVMIVDLLRNDLGRVAQSGTVEVTKLYELERYPTLWQMTSTVEAKLKPNTNLTDILSALFPCGSITGAPKISTMEIIRDLERFPRDIYTGTIGLIQPGGDCIFNVAIRTLLLDSDTGKVTFGVGGGITYDSTAALEYDECLLKSSFLNTPTDEFRLLESLLLEEQEYFLLARHLTRLRQSAEYFDFRYSSEELEVELEHMRQSHPAGVWKVRLLLARDGRIEVEAASLEKKDVPLRVALASRAVESSNVFLFHKTTNRSVYELELGARPDCDDVIFLNQEGEITESALANVVVSSGDEFWTPKHESGLLAGTFRQELLDRGEIRERTITLRELRNARELFLINSVRKWMPAILL